MPIQCDGAQARMMDLLYGELAGDDRAAVEAHVSGCVRCQAELAGFQRTRATLRGALEQSPPARAREIILRAATAQAAARPAAEKSARPPVPPPRISIGEWLRRRWALPTLATIGAVAVFLLASKMFLQPDKMLQTAAKDDSLIGELAEKAVPAAVQAPAPSPASRPAASAAAPPVSPVAAAPERLEAAKPSTWRGSGAAGGAQADRTAHNHAMAKKTAGGKVNREDEGPPSPAVASASYKSESKARFAAPPSPRAPASGGIANLAPTEPAAEQATPRKGSLDDSARASTAAAPAAAAPRQRAAAAPEEESASGPLAESYGESSSKRKIAKRKAAADDDGETPVQRADRLFAKARWAEAAVAYRRLLQQEPDNADAPRWRQRLAAAEKNARENADLEPTP